MLTREEDIDAHALRKQGWTISAIARHLGRDRGTVRGYLNGDTVPGVRKTSAADWFAPFEAYVRARFADDPHVWVTTLFDEVVDLGFDRSYQSFTRLIRARRLRPACEPCRPAKGRPVAVIEHPPGDETQWDWLELPDPPQDWGWGSRAFLLVGALAHSSRWRAVLAPSMDQPHLIDALDRVTRALGGVTRAWRFDRMATVVHPASGRVTASFAAVAKHYAVQVRICPPRRGNRKGVVEKANHVAAQRFWRTLADDVTVEQAQRALDHWCATRGDARVRPTKDGKASVVTLAAAEPLRPAPGAPFPAVLAATRQTSAQALVAWRGNYYSVPPELAHTSVTVAVRLGSGHLDISTQPSAGAGTGSVLPTVLARHRLAPDGAGVIVRDHGHVIALDRAAMTAAGSTAPPHRSKQRIPPGAAARAAADALRGQLPGAGSGPVAADEAEAVIDPPIDLSRYAAAAAGRNTLQQP
ncbi:IS21 family transposase [Kineosporia sp. A_224]|uniref:IS21 family transposase n=1 Tax=Kineosporia sp. A_224 TaxID=1962180 RepID=UPI000B4AD9EB|nr:IS21 family transposase [Kineosporia sp. A_224]